MQFALVIPALNEETAIAGTLRRALAARAAVCAQTPVKEMTIVFVNDGCTDRTQEIVDQPEFAEVVKVNYGRNRGYGAAIMAGFQASAADLVGFIDADGTCDPEFCVPLINTLLDQNADVTLARRLESNTEMPLIRKIGNRLFATLLGVMSGHTEITDTASGFRVIKRASLKLMSPLPTGLHYTPAMSCICLLDSRLKIVEVPGMHYKEREGRSKLHVLRDGFRFLWTILFSAACYSPIKTMLLAAALVTLFCAVLTSIGEYQDVAYFTRSGPILLLSWGLVVMILLAAGVVVHEMNFLLIGPRRRVGAIERLLQTILHHRRLITGGATIAILGLISIVACTTAGWSWTDNLVALILLILLTVLGAMAAMGGVVARVIWAVSEKQRALIAEEFQVHERPTPKPQPHTSAPASAHQAIPTLTTDH